MGDDNFAWYAVKVRVGYEKKAASLIKNEVKLSGLDNYVKDILVLEEKLYVSKNKKREQISRSWIKGYVFIHADPSDKVLQSLFQRVPLISGMLGGGGSGLQIEPVPLSKSEVNRILSYVNSDVNNDQIPEEREFVVGDIVKITSGPFNNLSGTISKVIPELKHVIVDIKIFTRLMSVELSYSQIE